ncbi:MAG: hypothetical protein CMA28_05365 [Euryarchaeota archaeon]|nr:hypothetical protein [Euryarchaeota archaeon]
MAKPPAEVRFPGDKNRRRKLRVRGIKQASREIQKRLEKTLDLLLDDPEAFMPEIIGNLGKVSFFGPKDPMAMTLKEVGIVSSKRNDVRWLKKRMSKRSGGDVARSLAGSLAAASEEDLSTVSVFKSEVYGNASYLKRGSGRPGHLVGIQNFNHPKLRLLVWDDHAKAGQYFFSWDGGFVFTGFEPNPPPEWVNWTLDNTSVELQGEDCKWSTGLDEGTVRNDSITKEGWLRLKFSDGTKVGLSQSALAKTDEPMARSIAVSMMPPNKLGEVCEATWMWRPEGWPEGDALPQEGQERLDEILQTWLKMSLEDGALTRACRASILNSISHGYVVGTNWFSPDDREGFLNHMSGTNDERRSLACILDTLTGGIHVRTDGVVLDVEEKVVRLEDSSCHPVLVSLWPDHGMSILEKIFGVTGDDAKSIHDRQSKRKQGFGAFLRELNDSLSTAKKLDRLPWDSSDLPSPLSFADSLVRKAADEGLASTVSMARKGKGLDSSMGWAWLVVHEKTESDSWRFDEESRDKGGDWVPALRALWDAATSLLLEDDMESVSDYVSSMEWLAEVSGSGPISRSKE